MANKLVVYSKMFNFSHDKELDYCLSCRQSRSKTLDRVCCSECNSKCNRSEGCTSEDCYCKLKTKNCSEGNHLHAIFSCPKCDHKGCWSCSVIHSKSPAEDGIFSCPKCRHTRYYPGTENKKYNGLYRKN